jgi:glycosyltransferase involved in cell wall biosynthesis
VKVAFVVNDLQLSGGVGVVVAHARHLATEHGFDVTLVLARPQESPSWRYEALTGVHVASLEEAVADRFDIAVATWWETTLALFRLHATRYAFFVQSLEDRFYRPDEAQRYGAAVTLDLPVTFITEASWIADTLADLRPDATCHLVRNGIDKTVFASPPAPAAHLDGPLRILVEGNASVWLKQVPEALKAAATMREPHHVTLVSGLPAPVSEPVDRVLTGLSPAEMAALYAESHVVLKLSAVEGMFGPPLEGFHMGATCVVTPVTGHDEYVVHGWNGLVADWDDKHGTASLLDLLARDRRLLHYLRHNALRTARGWPSWAQQGDVMAAVLHRILREPAPPVAPAMARLLADHQVEIDAHQRHLRELVITRGRVKRFERVLIRTGVARVLAARRQPPLSWGLRLARIATGRERVPLPSPRARMRGAAAKARARLPRGR